jgi:AcrR family transcriptional regulator
MSPRDPAPTRAAILAAAAELLEAGGPDAVTLRAVGTAAGVSRSAPYRHFEDKADLERALAAATLHALADRIRAEANRGDRRSRLRRGCAAYLEVAFERPHHYLLIFGDSPIESPDPEVVAAADDAMASIQEMTEVAQERAELAPGPPRELATVVWVLLHGMAQLQITRHLREPRTVEGVDGVNELLRQALTALRPGSPGRLSGRSSRRGPRSV